MIKLEMHEHDVRALIDLVSRAPLKEAFNLFVFLNQQLARHEEPEQQQQPPGLRAVPPKGEKSYAAD